MKKSIGIVLAIIMICSLATSAFADEGPATFTSDAVSGSVGETVVVYINISHNMAAGATINSMQFEIRYDSSAVKFAGLLLDDNNRLISDFFVNGSPLTNFDQQDTLLFAWADATGTDTQGVLLGLKFEILTTAGSALTINEMGYSTLASTSAEMVSYSSDPIVLGGVSVGSNQAPTPAPENVATATPSSSFDTNIITNVTLPPLTVAPSVIEPAVTDPATDSVEPSESQEADPTATAELDIPIIEETELPAEASAEPQDSDLDPVTPEETENSAWWIWLIGILGIAFIIGATVLFVKQKRK